MDSLPSEILWFLLNGAPSTPRTAACDWVPPGRRDRVRPFLDPCWRFAARAVCRLWREVIETPTSSEMARMYRHRSKRCYGVEGEDGHSDQCPKWATGRLVCASVVAQWIATDTEPWPHRDADAVWAWCAAYARASHKHVMAALIASDAPWAVDAAVTTGWTRASFADDHGDDGVNVNGDDSTLHCALDCVDQRGDWWDDQHGDEQGLRDALWDVAARHASYRTLLALAVREPMSHRAHALGQALDRACRAGRADTVRALLDGGVRPESAAWTHAACAPNPDCFIVLLDHAPDGPPSMTTTDAEDDFQSIDGGWLHDAITAGRWRILDVCRARGIPFDPMAAFLEAVRARQTRVLAWLWAHASVRPPAIDLAVAAIHAVGPHNRPRTHNADSLAWLCEVAGYVPSELDLAALIARACANRCAECALYLAERWPHKVLSLDAATLGSFFRACVCSGISTLGRFLAVVDRHGRPLGADAARRIDLWGALVMARVDSSRRWTHMPYVVACMRAAHDMAHQRPPRAADIAQIDSLALSTTTPLPCACMHTKSIEAAAETTPHNLKRNICDDATPCTDTAVLAALAPLATWCRPRPVSPDDLVPGWRRVPTAPAGTLDRITHDGLCRRAIDWLASVGLLMPPVPPPSQTRAIFPPPVQIVSS
ncbi:hypothetical protein pqer_cds_915 [Pandoravirus quercus]|uniref:F-box incomplete domain containing protein n=1 Tax=Pandoravirus quercus TaxID=2107709 RepID=A0A2U7UA65_9VIRU|nr:hypothetical protein pqer_cds_915 [Pandoravirus quercus]AVK75337.1 hypothetical protein pqer_cds_915 [Pandoravirus quercus]